MKPWGAELIVDARACQKLTIMNKEHIEEFAKALVDRINMIRHGEPAVVHFGEGNKTGFTLVQLITTSNITAHFSDETGDAYFNIFSCKDIEVDVALRTIFDFFGPKEAHFLFIERNAGSPMKTVSTGRIEQVLKLYNNDGTPVSGL